MITIEEIDTIRSIANRMNCKDEAAIIIVVNDNGTSMMIGGEEADVKKLRDRISKWFNKQTI